jgi:omega-6 fatty acid desaturase (delta-12 desaturase)
MFGIGPAYLFLLQHRLPVGLFRGRWRPWLSVMATNVAIAAVAAGLIWLIGLGPFLLVERRPFYSQALSGRGCSTSNTSSK